MQWLTEHNKTNKYLLPVEKLSPGGVCKPLSPGRGCVLETYVGVLGWPIRGNTASRWANWMQCKGLSHSTENCP